uniref:AMP_N domain-containing protein n=1 Tax=Meloidogyne hapla TaxID=6305 RepID=A0A1I8BRX5_MELHA
MATEDESSASISNNNQQQLNNNLIISPIISKNNSQQQLIKEVVVLQKNNLLQTFRDLFKNNEILDQPIDAYILPRTDAHNNEYISERDQRVKFISGFSGSSAWVIVTKESALLWTDGRYYIQAKSELFDEWTLMKLDGPDCIMPSDWIIQNLENGSKIGFDPKLFNFEKAKYFIKKLKNFGIICIPIIKNFVDILWIDRPKELIQKLFLLPIEECGEEINSKLIKVREEMKKQKCDFLLINCLDDIAWLFNLRGSDIPYTPIFYSYAIIMEINKIWLSKSINYEIGSLFDKKYYLAESPISKMRTIKNLIELNGMRNSNIRDSSALIKFLYWINNEISLGHLVDENRAARQINYYREQLDKFISISFETISAVDENAALPHYHVNENNNKIIKNESIYLFDSGGQYFDGTTDVTRTICFSKYPSKHFCETFTLVLRSHIDCACARFPSETSPVLLDGIARLPLWSNGYNFSHGVGHGVGHFLNVHEIPPYIGYRERNFGLKKGNVVTIEPGYYEENNFGIRIENCYEIVEAKNLKSGYKNFLEFEVLTFVPIQKNLIVRELLEQKHIDWLNNYHNKCFSIVGRYLQEKGMQV